MSKQYSVPQWVGNSQADKWEVTKLLCAARAKGRLWTWKDARESLARRRFAESIKKAGVA